MMKGFESKISDAYQKYENQEKNGKLNFKLNRFKENPIVSFLHSSPQQSPAPKRSYKADQQ